MSSLAASITKSSNTSFYYSFAVLPKQKRDAISAVYAFCRYTDDIVDEGTDEGAKSILLRKWRMELGQALREVRCAPTDIDDENPLDAGELVQRLLMVMDPGVEGCLRLFQQDHARQSGAVCRLDRQLPGDFVKGSRDGEDDVLRLQGHVGKVLLPDLSKVEKISRRSLDG